MAFNPSDYLTKVSGNDYLEVKWRLVWVRDEHPEWSIQTELIQLTDRIAVRAEVRDGDDRVLATAHKEYSKFMKGGIDCGIEKAETGAIGRALAIAGYGTQHCGDEMTGNGPADAPVRPNRPSGQPGGPNKARQKRKNGRAKGKKPDIPKPWQARLIQAWESGELQPILDVWNEARRDIKNERTFAIVLDAIYRAVLKRLKSLANEMSVGQLKSAQHLIDPIPKDFDGRQEVADLIQYRSHLLSRDEDDEDEPEEAADEPGETPVDEQSALPY